MALLFVDGFDFWTTMPGCWTSEEGSLSVSGGKLTVPGTSFSQSFIRWTFPGSYQTVIVNIRTAFAAKTTFQDEPIFALFDGDSIQCTVTCNSAGQLSVFRGHTTGTRIGSVSTSGLTQDSTTYYDIEVKIAVANSGSCIINVNGDEVLNVTGDLASTANETCNNIAFGKTVTTAPGNNSSVIHEHVIVMNNSGTEMNDFIGPVQVNPHVVTADGNYTTFVANTGARWEAVNDTDPDDATTFISADVVGDKYTAVVDNLPAGITTVHAVAVWTRARRDDDATRAYKTLLRYAAGDQLSADDKYLGPSYGYEIATFNVSPFSSIAWTTTEVDGLEVGVQITI